MLTRSANQLNNRRLAPAALAATLALAGLAAPSQAGARAIVGIGDQNVSTFSDPLFTPLKVKRTRLFTPWNSILTEPGRLDGWIRAARAAGMEPLIAFEKARGDVCPGRPCRLPSVKAYAKAFKAFRRKYPFIKLLQPWNEANSPTQPTGRNPKRAAQFYNVVRGGCRGCKVTAADLLDLGLDKRSGQKRFAKWVKTFLRTARGTPKLWGLHNYGDTNRFRTVGIDTLLRLVKGHVWLTETGGVVKFTTQRGVQTLPASESRAAKAMKFLLGKLVRRSRRIQRVYIYHWKARPGDRFDAGLVAPNGAPRKSYTVLKKFKRLIR